MNNLSKAFWTTLFISFILINENFVQWWLAILIGKHTLISGFQDAYKYFTVTGYLFLVHFA